MEIFHISAECYPVAKVGGLADVVGALPKYQNLLSHNAKVVVPAYGNKFVQENDFENIHNGQIKLGQFEFSYSILKEKTNKLGFELFLIAIPELFDRPNVYSYEDDTERFISFQIAFLNSFAIGLKSPPSSATQSPPPNSTIAVRPRVWPARTGSLP